MANGKLGAERLAATTNTVVYTVPSSKIATLNIIATNCDSTAAAVRIAITSESTPTTPDDADWIVYGDEIDANSILELKGIVCSGDENVVAYASTANVTIRVHGFEE
jgi:hypothetical protein